ncbi:ATPase [Nanoarchaeota archaeon]|nr:MAG: ATPase [Nanoarchaeota archaeon]
MESQLNKQSYGKKVKSGIFGLDELIGGGFIPGSVVLVSGKAGTGKTIFCSQFLYYGITQYNENGIYITTEELEKDIKEDVFESFGWDFESLEKEGKLVIVHLAPNELGKIKTVIMDAVRKNNVKRAVIDSVSLFEQFIGDPFEARMKLYEILRSLKESGVTTLITAEIPEESKSLSRSGVIEFQVDGVIVLQFVPFASRYKRSLVVRKMRRVDHSLKIHPFEITNRGIEVKLF